MKTPQDLRNGQLNDYYPDSPRVESYSKPKLDEFPTCVLQLNITGPCGID